MSRGRGATADRRVPTADRRQKGEDRRLADEMAERQVEAPELPNADETALTGDEAPAERRSAVGRRRSVEDDVWRLFSSPKLALVLILAIAAACLVGALVQQAPSEIQGNSQAIRTWVERVRPKYGFWTDLFQSLGFFWIFQGVWFRALFGLVAINTVVCTINRLPAIWKDVFHPRLRPGDGLFERGQPRETMLLASTSPETAERLARQVLWRRWYRVVRTAEADATYFYADRFRLASLGTLLTHSALILVMAATVLQGPLGFFEEPGFAVPVGSTREVGHDTGLAIYVEDFADEYQPDGRPKDYRSDAVLFHQGREVARQTIRVNEPLGYNGVRIHQAYYGQSAVVSIAETGGTSLFRDAVALTWRSNDGQRAVGYFPLPAQDLHVYLVGTTGEGDPIVRPGELLVEAYRGQATQPTYRATLTQRQPVLVGGLEFVFERELPFTGLRVVRDPGAILVWLACAMLVLGLAVTFYLPRRRLWLRVTSHAAGASVVLVGSGKEVAGELRRLAEAIEGRVGAAEPKTAPAPSRPRALNGRIAPRGSPTKASAAARAAGLSAKWALDAQTLRDGNAISPAEARRHGR